MPENRFVRFTLALFVLITLGITGRNGYQRYLDYRLASALQETVHQEFDKLSDRLAARKALAKRKLEAVQSLLAQGANPNLRVDRYAGNNPTPDFESALGYAFGDMDVSDNSAASETIVCLLIQHGSDINASTAAKDFLTEKDSYPRQACQKGSLSVLRCLLARGAHPDEADLSAALSYQSVYPFYPNPTAEQIAAANKVEVARHRVVSQQMVDLLRAHGAQFALTVHLNKGQSNLAALKAQLEAGMPADPPDAAGASSPPLYQAAQNGNVEAVQLLLAHGANINLHHRRGSEVYDTPLCAAAGTGNVALLKLMLEHGANINDGSDTTPLHSAIYFKRTEAIKLLLSRGADPKYHLDHGFIANTSLTAAIKNMPELVPDLLKRGVDVNSENSEPLRAAITARRLDLVQDLLRRGTNVNPTRPSEQTGFPIFSPLAVAVFNAPELEETLRRAGARLDAVDKLNCLATALNENKLKQQYTSVNLPLRPLDMSQKENQRKLLLKLLALGVDINGVDGEGETPLTQAVQHMPASVGLLLEHGAKPNVVPRDPRLPLELAVQAGQEENVRLLLAHGADPNARTTHSHTALYWARRHNYANILTLLKQAGATLDQ